MKTKIYRYTIVEGEHAGHHVVTDAWAIDYQGADPETAVYCLDCHEGLVLTRPEEPQDENDNR